MTIQEIKNAFSVREKLTNFIEEVVTYSHPNYIFDHNYDLYMNNSNEEYISYTYYNIVNGYRNELIDEFPLSIFKNDDWIKNLNEYKQSIISKLYFICWTSSTNSELGCLKIPEFKFESIQRNTKNNLTYFYATIKETTEKNIWNMISYYHPDYNVLLCKVNNTNDIIENFEFDGITYDN